MPDEPRFETPLDRIMKILGLKSSIVVDAANAFARERGSNDTITRQHLLRLRRGVTQATEGRIFILVAAIRELTGYAIQANQLFSLETAAPAGMPPFDRSAADPRQATVPVFSARALNARRLFLPNDGAPPGDETFDALYAHYGILLRSIAMRRYSIPPDDAEALVHDTFIAYLQRRESVQQVKPWLMTAVCNASKNYWRERKREAPLPEGIEERPDGAADAVTEQAIARLSVASALARLGEKCRETLHRYYFREESKETIAKTLSTSPAYVLQLLVSCRRRVKALLDRDREPRG